MIRLILTLAFGAFAMTATANEAEDRKARSIAILEAESIPYLGSLPLIETEKTALRRSDDEVIERAIALAIVAVKGETRDHALGLALIDQFDADGFFSPDELAYLNDPNPNEQTHINFIWRYESTYVMLWALGFYDDLGQPADIVNVGQMAGLLRDLGTEGLRREGKLRPQSEILDAADLIYRYNWAAVNARVNGKPPPTGINPSVAYERHYALNWLIGYLDQAWDDISTDT